MSESIAAPPAPVPDAAASHPVDLSGAKKAAVLLVTVGQEAASQVLKHLAEREVEQIAIEIAKMKRVSSEVVETVLMEYRDVGMLGQHVAQGGLEFTRATLEEALGGSRAEEVMMKVEAAMEVSAFHLLQTVDTEQLVNFLQGEHPQTAALILAHLNPRKAGDIISGLNPEVRSEVVMRMATMGKTSPEMLADIEEVIREQIGSLIGAATLTAGGVEAVAQVLNNTSRSVEKNVMQSLRERDAELATVVKSLMFVFDDLVHISDRDMQRLLMEVEQKDLALALKAVSEDLKEKILGNVSERAAQTIQEEVELMGPARISNVEEAQRRILETAQDLEEQQEISLSTANEEML